MLSKSNPIALLHGETSGSKITCSWLQLQILLHFSSIFQHNLAWYCDCLLFIKRKFPPLAVIFLYFSVFFYKAPHSRSRMLAFKLLYKERREIRRHQLNQTGVNLERSSKSPDIIFSTPSDQIFFGQFSWEGVTFR